MLAEAEVGSGECSRWRALRLGALAGGMNRHYHGEPGAHRALKRVPWIKRYLNRDSLDDFGEVACCIIRRQQRELRTAGRGNLDHLSVKHNSGEGIDLDVGDVSLADVG